jgi:hypothetical protein
MSDDTQSPEKPNTENSSKLPQTLPDDFRIGGKDNAGENIIDIYLKNKNFVVYRTKQRIQVDINNEVDKEDKVYWFQHQKISVKLARIDARLPRDLSKSEPLNQQIARAIAVNLSGVKRNNLIETENIANDLLKEVQKQLKHEQTTQGRITYFLSSLILPIFFTTLLLLALSWEKINFLSRTIFFCGLVVIYIALFVSNIFDVFFFNLFNIFITMVFCILCVMFAYFIHDNNIYIMYLKVMLFGALGGVFSVATTYSSLDIDIDAPRYMNILIGVSRVVISTLGAIFVYFHSLSNVQPTNANNTYLIYLLVMLAGFSEKLVPNIIQNLSGDESKKDEPKAPNPENNSKADVTTDIKKESQNSSS